VPNLVCLQQFCCKCENVQDINIDCEKCGRRKHTIWDDPVGDLLISLCKSRPWCNKILAIAHNAKASDLHFILNRAIVLRWKPKLIVNGLKIVCMTMEHLTFIDSTSFMPCSLRKLPEAFGLTAAKSWYPHYFNTNENMNYVGEISAVSYYLTDAMSAKERAEFLAWYESQRSAVFDNRNVLEAYCQDDVTVLRQACIVFRREFIEIGNVDVFTESVTITSACNKLLRKRFLQPNTIGILPTGGYSCNVNQSKKALMWLVHRERTDECRISHGRNGREFRLPELPNLCMDGY